VTSSLPGPAGSVATSTVSAVGSGLSKLLLNEQ
jgi:hypothetical protein